MGKMATRAASLLGFLLFFVVCHAICKFFNFNLEHLDLRNAISNVLDLK